MSISPYTTVFEARAMELIELQQWWVEVSEAQSYLLGIANLPEDIRMCMATLTSDAKHAVFDWKL